MQEYGCVQHFTQRIIRYKLVTNFLSEGFSQWIRAVSATMKPPLFSRLGKTKFPCTEGITCELWKFSALPTSEFDRTLTGHKIDIALLLIPRRCQPLWTSQRQKLITILWDQNTRRKILCLTFCGRNKTPYLDEQDNVLLIA